MLCSWDTRRGQAAVNHQSFRECIGAESRRKYDRTQILYVMALG
jgi:hypothetical protein